jgi:hypothetical protein
VSEWLSNRTPRQWLGVGLFLAGALLTCLLAYLGNTETPPAASTQALTALLGILAQGGAVWAFSGVGRADPGLAQRAVARLYRLAQHSASAREVLEDMYENEPPAALVRKQLGGLSVTLSFLEEGYIEAMEDWRTFHPQIVEEVEGRGDEQGT